MFDIERHQFSSIIMEFFDWESVENTDLDLSEMLASIPSLDVPASPPLQLHPSISDADLLGLSLTQHGHESSNVLHPDTDSGLLDGPLLQV